MSDSGVTRGYTVKEIRLGLFRICWENPDYILRFSGITAQQIELCGSQLGRNFTISFGVSSNEFQVKVFTQPNVVGGKSIVDKEPGHNRQQLNESPKSEKLEVTVKENLVKPTKIWLESAVNVSPIKLSELNNCNDTWEGNHVKHRYEVKECSIVVWIDFGTSEVKQAAMINTLAEMLNNQTYCDVNFLFKNGQSIGAHIIILSAASPAFAAMFQSKGLKKSETQVVVIEEINMEVFKQLLNYLYTSKAPQITKNNRINVMLLYEAADKYGVVDLKEECVKMLLIHLDAENVIELLVWSEFHSVPELFKEAIKMTVQNCKKLCSQPTWLYLMKRHPELCLEVTKKMADMVEDFCKY